MSSRTASASRRRASISTLEFLIDEPSFQPHHMPYHQEPGHARHRRQAPHHRSGADAAAPQGLRFRPDDPALRLFGDAGRFAAQLFLLAGRRLKGSQNLAGIADPAIDALIDRVIAADSRAELTTACRALDRLIRAGRYWIPHWYKASHWIAYWDTFGRPPTKPRYARGVPETGGTIAARRPR